MGQHLSDASSDTATLTFDLRGYVVCQLYGFSCSDVICAKFEVLRLGTRKIWRIFCLITLTFDLLTSLEVHGLLVWWASILPILDILPFHTQVRSRHATERQTDRHQRSFYNVPPLQWQVYYNCKWSLNVVLIYKKNMSDFLVLASLDIRKWCLAGASYAHQWKPRQKD